MIAIRTLATDRYRPLAMAAKKKKKKKIKKKKKKKIKKKTKKKKTHLLLKKRCVNININCSYLISCFNVLNVPMLKKSNRDRLHKEISLCSLLYIFYLSMYIFMI